MEHQPTPEAAMPEQPSEPTPNETLPPGLPPAAPLDPSAPATQPLSVEQPPPSLSGGSSETVWQSEPAEPAPQMEVSAGVAPIHSEKDILPISTIPCLETKEARKYHRQAIKQALRDVKSGRAIAIPDSDTLSIVLNHKHASVQTAARLAQTCKQFRQATMAAHLDVALNGQVGLAYFAQTAPLAHCWRIVVLDLSGCEDVPDVSALASLVGLKELNLSGCEDVADVSALASLDGLEKLNLHCTSVVDVSALASLVGLKELNLSHCRGVADVSALASLVGLKELSLADTAVTDVSALASLIGLKELNLHCTSVVDVSALASLIGLEKLDLSGTDVVDVSALASLIHLEKLDLMVTDVAGQPVRWLTGHSHDLAEFDWSVRSMESKPGRARGSGEQY